MGCGAKTVVIVATPAASPTKDAQADLAAAVADDILEVKTAMLEVQTGSALLNGVQSGSAAVVAGANQMVIDGCTRLRQPAKHLDLWPTPFKEARSAFAAPCLGVQKYLAGDAQFADWGRTVQLFIPFKVKIDAAMKALPDYSRGQLIRAIQDRQ